MVAALAAIAGCARAAGRLLRTGLPTDLPEGLRTGLCAGLLTIAGGLAAAAPTPVSAAPATHVVVIENMRFSPEQLTVRAGDRVTWVNKDLVPHTASAVPAGFDSQNIEAGASWTYTAGVAGNYAYACRYHPGMTATLVVQ